MVEQQQFFKNIKLFGSIPATDLLQTGGAYRLSHRQKGRYSFLPLIRTELDCSLVDYSVSLIMTANNLWDYEYVTHL